MLTEVLKEHFIATMRVLHADRQTEMQLRNNPLSVFASCVTGLDQMVPLRDRGAHYSARPGTVCGFGAKDRLGLLAPSKGSYGLSELPSF